MRTRWYHPTDDAALMQLERQCPRGDPTPFVHYRRRFIDRAASFRDYCVLLVENDEGAIVACAAAAIKETVSKRQPVRLAYIFDVRVAPPYRRVGMAFTLLTGLEQELLTTFGCDGAYAHIVGTNRPSLRLFDALGYERRRQIRLLSYLPYPLIQEPPLPHIRRHEVPNQRYAEWFHPQDLWVDDAAPSLAKYGFELWDSHDHCASISLYNQNDLFQQVPSDAPWPTEAEMAKRAHHWRLFHPHGDSKILESLFATLRDVAVSENINRLSILIDSESPIPAFFYADTQTQREYVVVTNSYSHRWDGTFGKELYCDPREL